MGAGLEGPRAGHGEFWAGRDGSKVGVGRGGRIKRAEGRSWWVLSRS